MQEPRFFDACKTWVRVNPGFRNPWSFKLFKTNTSDLLQLGFRKQHKCFVIEI
jgi:hypothetical protein